MPRGDKSKYTDKQERKADHIAEGCERRGDPEKEAERRAWATVNKDDGGGKQAGGSGRGKSTGHPAAHKGGEKGGAASASRSTASRSACEEGNGHAERRPARLIGRRLALINLYAAFGPRHAFCQPRIASWAEQERAISRNA